MIGAGALFAAGFAGSQVVDMLPNPDLPRPLQSGIAIPFTLVSLVSFGVALAAVLADRLPAVGRHMGPMMKTVLISNLMAGTVGGWAGLILLCGGRRPTSFRRSAASPTKEHKGETGRALV